MSKERRKCWFCGTNNEVVLQNAHVIPLSLSKKLINPPTYLTEKMMPMCVSCHKKFDHLVFKFWKKLFAHYYLFTVESPIIKEKINNNQETVEVPKKTIEHIIATIDEVLKAYHKLPNNVGEVS